MKKRYNTNFDMNAHSKLFILILLILFGHNKLTNAQTAIIGTGSVVNSSNTGPIFRSSATSNFDYSQHIYLYTATELAAAGILPGSLITQIAWRKSNSFGTVPTNTSSIWRVYMKNSSAVPSATWSNAAFFTQTTGATLVYDNPSQVIPTVFGYIPLTLSSPFLYTGGNLEIGSSWNCSQFVGSPTTGIFNWHCDNVTNQTFGGSSSLPAPTMSLQTLRPQILINYTYSTPCSAIPVPGNTISNVPSVCPGVNFTLSLQNSFSLTGLSYVWQSANDAAFTNGVTNLGTSLNQNTTQTAAKWYRCMVACVNNPTVAYSTPLYMPMSEFYNCSYCSLGLTSTGSEFDGITNVTLETLNQSSSSAAVAPWYTSYNNTPPLLTRGTSHSISITFGGEATQHYAVWIDFNHDGSFSASENVLAPSLAVTYYATATNPILIPTTSLTGITRMRVRGGGDLSYSTNACASQLYGETEDYLVEIQSNTTCSSVSTPGATLSNGANPVCAENPFTLSMASSPSGIGISYQWQSSLDATFNSASNLGTGATQTISSQTNATYYRCIVSCSNGSSAISTPLFVNQNGYQFCYCIPTTVFGCSDGDVIAQVILNTLDNASGVSCSSGITGYSDYTSNSNLGTDLTLGSSYDLKIFAGARNESFAAWIDYNDNGIFEHPSERIGYTLVPVAGSNQSQVIGSSVIFPIVLDCNKPIGEHRMRVRAMNGIAGSSMTPCGNTNYGETEDYLINIDPPATNTTYVTTDAPNCDFYTWPINNQTYYSSGTYTSNMTLTLLNLGKQQDSDTIALSGTT